MTDFNANPQPEGRVVYNRSNPNILKYIAYGMLAVSFVLIVLGVYFYQKEDKFLSECRLITCKIIQIDEPVKGEAVLIFKDINGNAPPFKYDAHYDETESDLAFKQGETYEVYYYAKDPSRSEIKGFFENHGTSFILIIIGFSCLIDFPILLMVSGKAEKQRKQKQQMGITGSVISE
jgi:hypothetical protein